MFHGRCVCLPVHPYIWHTWNLREQHDPKQEQYKLLKLLWHAQGGYLKVLGCNNPKQPWSILKGIATFSFFLFFILSLCCQKPVSVNSGHLTTPSSTAQVHGNMGTPQCCNWTGLFSTKHLSFNFIMQRRVKANSYRIKSHKSPHAWNHRRKGVAGPTSSLLFVLSPRHSTPTPWLWGYQGNPSCALCSLCHLALPLVVCHGAGVGASICHLPLAPEEKETEQIFYRGLVTLDGDGSHYTQGKRYNWDKKPFWLTTAFFERCTWCQQIDLSTALYGKNLWKVMHYLQKKVNRRFTGLKSQGKHRSLSWNVKKLI